MRKHILSDDNQPILPDEPGNLVFCPPEYIRAVLDEETRPRGREQAMFMLGMLSYFMYTGTDYYSQKGMSVLEAASESSGFASVIGTEDVSRIPFGKALVQLTAAAPEQRAAGMRAFLQFFPKERPGTAVLYYEENGTRIKTEERQVRADIDDLHPSGRISVGGRSYMILNTPVCIPYRPGKHCYTISVQHVDAGVPNTTIKTERVIKKTPFGQPAVKGRWLYLCKTDGNGKTDYDCVMSLLTAQDSARSEAIPCGVAKCEALVVDSEGGEQAYITHRCQIDRNPHPTEKLRFVYRAAANLVEIQLQQADGTRTALGQISLKKRL